MFPWEPEGQDLRWPCKYSIEGCPAKLSLRFKSIHERVCKFRPCPCVLGATACTWNGPLKDVATHIARNHSFIPKFQDDKVVLTAHDFQREEDFSWFALLSCFREDFLVMLLKRRCPDDEDEPCFIAEVLMIGPSVETVNFVYRLELVGPHCRLRWEGRPVSVHRNADISVTGGGGFLFLAKAVQQFTDGEDLILNVIISECNNATPWEHFCRSPHGDAVEDIWGSLSG